MGPCWGVWTVTQGSEEPVEVLKPKRKRNEFAHLENSSCLTTEAGLEGARQEVGKPVGFVVPLQPGCQRSNVCGAAKAKTIVWHLC